MKKQFLEAGKIVNTHGIRGEVKIQPWCSSPDFLRGLKKIYIDGSEFPVRSCRINKEMAVMSLGGVDTVEAAAALKNKIIFLNRDDVSLEQGEYFVQDLIGLKIVDADSGEEIGILNDIISGPGRDIYEIRGEREILVPAVPEFIIEKDVDMGIIKVRLIDGM